ncbi:MAG: glutamyl-tRNA reductase, partial [Deltaproteobacteria bacterium]|nr:glutamyl-tRNA reductase [Deltaproteobacteria bacterium]
IGAGEMAELAAEHLLGQGIKKVVVANRTLTRAMKLAKRFNGTAVGLDELVEQLLNVDIIISSTGAADLVLFKKDVASIMRGRRNQPLFFIDIAVPRDLDPKINELDNVYLYDIDDLNNVVEINREQRDKEAIKARRIVEEETLKFGHWLDSMEVTPTIVELRAAAESICRTELAKTLPRLNGLDPKEKKSIEKMASSIVGKMLHHPMLYLKSDHPCSNREDRISTVRSLFQLDESNSSEKND